MRKLALVIPLILACSTPPEIADTPPLDVPDMTSPAAAPALVPAKLGRIVSQVLFHTNPDGTKADMGRVQYDTEFHSIVTLGYDRLARMAWLPTDSWVPVRRLSDAPPAAHSAASSVYADSACSVPFVITGEMYKPRFAWLTVGQDSLGLPSATAIYEVGSSLEPAALWTRSGTCAQMTGAQIALFMKNRALWRLGAEIQPERLAQAQIGAEIR